MPVTLRTLPITVDAQAIAKGLLELMSESERTGVRFGLLPARVMTALKRRVDAFFRERYAISPKLPTSDADPDAYLYNAYLTSGEVVEFKLPELVDEIVRAVTLALFEQVPMVV